MALLAVLQWLGTFDFEAMEFTSDGTVYHFPRDNHCDVSRQVLTSTVIVEVGQVVYGLPMACCMSCLCIRGSSPAQTRHTPASRSATCFQSKNVAGLLPVTA